MYVFTSQDDVRIHVHEWAPDGPPRGIVQLAHGMGEHAARYAPLAEALVAAGYAVYAGDHRGHGMSIHTTPGDFGDDGWNRLVADVAAISRTARERHPGLPLVLVGHSMGSFASQQYLLDYAELVDGIALCGTSAPDQLFAGLAGSGDDMMAALNKSFEPVRTSADWLSRDEAQVDAYIADPLCGFALQDASMGALVAAAPRLAEPVGMPADLPLYVLVGDRDPVNAGLALSDLLVQRYRDAGLRDVTYRTYPEARHELFNETNRDEVFGELIAWIDRVVG
ncbi:alpha/beta hydrolase [Nocardioides sp. NPDC000445]|uniref:alpha/beta hydrolase n=1 Tax=Nocardioides sp. NPDC000445 TaxID=3154257 RepID=UPI00331C84E7